MNNTSSERSMPLDIGTLHFVGIGGIGMSGIAEILHNLGYTVKGSDSSKNANVDRLRNLGIEVNIGQKAENVDNVAVVVRSSAVQDNNPEIAAARKQRIPVIQRAEMLAELMRLKTSVAVAGTHGKTTTTSLTTALFEAEGLDPTVVNGGIINAYGTNARLGGGRWLVAEADESDGSFLKLPATVGIITNIDPEHMEHYGSFDNLRTAFRQFIERLPFYGFAVLCKDHPEVDALIGKIADRKVISYGIESDADIRGENIYTKEDGSGSTYDVRISDRLNGGKRVLKGVTLAMPGMHNVLNSLASIAVAVELGFRDESIIKGLGNFQGVKRRFTKTGEVGGVTIIDDYGHHPKEIAVTLRTARTVVQKKGGKVIAVVQPHRYSRVRDLFDEFSRCFADADIVIVADIYEAGETPIEGINRDSLIAAIRKNGHADVRSLNAAEELPALVKNIARPNDLVVCLGAGTVSQWANALPEELEKIIKDAG